MDAVKHIIIGTAGHVDHGKTTLIRALTGIDTDRLMEEKARGMTIDLGFAFLELPGISAGIVDVPGHERFVKNMLAGAGGIDLALIVVAADEGPMPQTEEHLDILTVLNVTHGVVALTKTDLADEVLRELAIEATRDALNRTPLANVPIVPVSATKGEGLRELKATLASVAAGIPTRDANAPFRLPVDRVFSLAGVGTVVTGTLIVGTLNAGDAVAVQPQNLMTKARTLQAHNQKIDRAVPGMRVAVNLPGIEVGQIERGAVLCPPETLSATNLFDAHLSLLETMSRPGKSPSLVRESHEGNLPAVRHRERVRLHLGTGEILARVQLLDKNEIMRGASDVPVQLLCETKTAPARGERFVVRTYSPARAIGGGVVLDAHPARRYRRGDAAALALFEARGTGEMTQTVYAALAAKHTDFTPAEIAAAIGLSEDMTVIALETLVDERRAEVLTDGRYLSDVAANRLKETARKTLTVYHRQNPYKKAMPRDGLRSPLLKAAVFRDFNAIVLWLIAEGIVVGEPTRRIPEEIAWGVRLPEHEVTIPVGWRKASDEILAVYRGAGFQPPSPGNFQANYPRDVHVATILTILAENDELVPIADDLYLTPETVQEARRILRRLAQSSEGITVASVRDATGSSRKVILPLLEYFDARRITRRQGDLRVLVDE